MELPHAIESALTDLLAATPRAELTRATGELSRRYRGADESRRQTPIQSRVDVMAYAAYRFPATFAALAAVLDQVRDNRPQWSPRTLLDAGAGPGTAAWAALATWPSLEQITLVERDALMISFGQDLARRAGIPSMEHASWHKADMLDHRERSAFDLVMAAYMLGEQLGADQEAAVQRLWSWTADTLVLVEPGTPRGFSIVRQARQQLLAAGGTVVAPCPHDNSCPMGGADWCHFSQRVNRSRLHRSIKRGALSYEDEKFSYVAISRSGESSGQDRIIRHPMIREGHISLELCTPVGLASRTVSRRDGALFRAARHLRWGETLPPQ